MANAIPEKLMSPHDAVGATFRSEPRIRRVIPNRAEGILGDTSVVLKPGCKATLMEVEQNNPKIRMLRVVCPRDCGVGINYVVTQPALAKGEVSDVQIAQVFDKLCDPKLVLKGRKNRSKA